MRRALSFAGLGVLLAAVLGSRQKLTTITELQDDERQLGRELRQFIDVVNRVNDESDREYVAVLAQLREAKADVLGEAREIVSGRAGASFGLRHSTVLAVAALRDEAALDLLSEVALNPQPIPPQPSPDRRTRLVHGSQAQVESEMLALDALDGLRALADDGHERATEGLYRAATSGTLAVRAVALAALADQPQRRELLARARAALPAELRHLGLSRFVAVQDVPQVRDPRRHLAHPEQGSPPSPPLPGDGQPRPQPEPRRSQAPRIPREAPHG